MLPSPLLRKLAPRIFISIPTISQKTIFYPLSNRTRCNLKVAYHTRRFMMQDSSTNHPDTEGKIYVQHSARNDMMTISFEFKADGRIKQFNLHRKATEPLSISLERMKLNIQKLSRPKKSKSREANDNQKIDQPKIELAQDGDILDPNVVSNVDAWKEGAILYIGGQPFHISMNEPQVGLLKLPSSIMKGFIVLPDVILSNCTIDNCYFTWYRRLASKDKEKLDQMGISENQIEHDGKFNWLKICNGLTYSPADEDVAQYLKVMCRPSNGIKYGLSQSCVSDKPVQLGPTTCPFDKRHTQTKERFEKDSNEFRFISYNILADLYADSDYSRTVLFAHCPAHALEIDYRRQLLLKELLGYNADIICLQEVDKKEFNKTYRPFFELVGGLSGVYDTKGGQVAEGVAMFYRNDRFQLIESHKTVLSDLIDPFSKVAKDDADEIADQEAVRSKGQAAEVELEQAESTTSRISHPILSDIDSAESKKLMSKFDSIRTKIFSNELLKKRFLGRHTILQTSLLQVKNKPNNYVLVANTHLYFAPDADHVRLLQGSVCVKYMEYIKDYFRKKLAPNNENRDPCLSIVFAGDMNSSPDCGLFNLLHNSRIDADLPDWSSNKDETVPGMAITTNLKFKSAYQNIAYTNYTPGFNGCLDYIYYELNNLECVRTIPMPDHDDVIAIGGIPSDVFPSDHLALIADLRIK